ncbi:hypothetical protein [Oceanithermus desulfurans]|uniref:DUF4878 domain-containing protein n=2 Tax=Oceanithermus desulfurans TaxID=227924 RepID=A0A511RIL6_9DEIN|nr:hypothetical protein [Oceanithermus desulfurans]MBB6030638.1 hypothetical protein [Oceanithermus desulfurans]GEM89484.1 hypothetical protein ODE01S_09180 [Oceanithermus desulfurans NBRC 100063]
MRKPLPFPNRTLVLLFVLATAHASAPSPQKVFDSYREALLAHDFAAWKSTLAEEALADLDDAARQLVQRRGITLDEAWAYAFDLFAEMEACARDYSELWSRIGEREAQVAYRFRDACTREDMRKHPERYEGVELIETVRVEFVREADGWKVLRTVAPATAKE